VIIAAVFRHVCVVDWGELKLANVRITAHKVARYSKRVESFHRAKLSIGGLLTFCIHVTVLIPPD
jgi:hypothetical protein